MSLRRTGHLALAAMLAASLLPAAASANGPWPMRMTEVGPYDAERNRVLTIRTSCIDTAATGTTTSVQRFHLAALPESPKILEGKPLAGRVITLGPIDAGTATLTASPMSGTTDENGNLDITFTAGPGTVFEKRTFPVTYDGFTGTGIMHLNVALGMTDVICERASWDDDASGSEGGLLEITSPKQGRDFGTNAGSVELGGTFGEAITQVTVNGTAATLNGASRNWHTRVDLASGENTLVARGYGADGTELASDTIVITREKEKKSEDGNDEKPKKFEDVPASSSAAPAIEKLRERGIVKGRPDGTFDPDGFVTRGEFAKMLAGAMGIPATDTTSGFKDVPEDHSLSAFIAAISRKGWAKGQDGKFHPDRSVSRMEAARMIFRAKALVAHPTTAFKDVTSSEEQGVVGAIVKADIARGDGEQFAPGRKLTRAEAAIMLAALI